MYKPMNTAPEGFEHHFLVRPKGAHPASGEKFVPTAVIQFDGELYTPLDHIHPLKWNKVGTRFEPTTKIAEADLEWHELPE